MQAVRSLGWRGVGWLVALGAVALPCASASGYLATVGTQIGINAIVVLGLALLMGYAGQVSLGHAAFYAVGAYASAILTTRLHWPPLAGIAAGLLVAAAIALLVGLPALRLRGHYLAMFTLGLGIIAQILLEQGGKVTGGFDGLTGVPALGVGSLRLESPKSMFVATVIALAVAALVARNLVRSRQGRALRALHESEEAASACGVDVTAAKLQVFVLSAMMASLAGSLYAHSLRFVSPEPFGFRSSVMFMVMMVVGGSASVAGPVAGAALFTVLQQFLQRLGQRISFIDDIDTMLFGTVLVLVVVFCHKGLVSIRLPRRTGRPGAEPTGGAP